MPWRTKNVFRITTSLPARLIDSIMAQGNWNLLFQESPFVDFQHTLAVANFFAMRDDTRQAEYYFEKARNNLAITYASLRADYGWPKNFHEIKNAQSLPWGESRDAFEDFLLCRFQLSIELLLAGMNNLGEEKDKLAAEINALETQLGKTLRQKDASFAAAMMFIQHSFALRQNETDKNLLAARFAQMSDAQKNSISDYWQQRLLGFKIQENIRYGNLGRALFLIRFIEENKKEKVDAVALVRLYIRCGAFSDAERLLTNTLASPEIRFPDNFNNYTVVSQLYENLMAWRGEFKRGETQTQIAYEHITSLLMHEDTLKEDFVDMRKAAHNERLRQFIFAYIDRSACPSRNDFVDDSDMEREWLFKQAIFFERCKIALDKAVWAPLVQSMTNDEKQILAYHRREELVQKNQSTIAVFINARFQLRKVLKRKNKKSLPFFLTKYLKAQNAVHPIFFTLDWGLYFSDNLVYEALQELPGAITKKEAWQIFTELNRTFAWQKLSHGFFTIFEPPEASLISQKANQFILDVLGDAAIPDSQNNNAHALYFTDGKIALFYEPQGQKGKLWHGEAHTFKENLKADDIVFFGDALNLQNKLSKKIRAFLPALFFQCDTCKNIKAAPRFVASTTSTWASELSDNFSVVWNFERERDCLLGESKYSDTLLLINTTSPPELPCNLTVENIIIDVQDKPSVFQSLGVLSLGYRERSALISMPRKMEAQNKIAFLFDLFQKTNRRQIPIHPAFEEAKQRAEKSFSTNGEFSTL
ncbi:MAG TPA: hypothetical protein PLY93_08415, partial [Turneriella sp.]|nr:hypothetical protein [Turneriella sp.]